MRRDERSEAPAGHQSAKHGWKERRKKGRKSEGKSREKGREKTGKLHSGMNANFQIDRVDPSNLPIKQPLAKTKTIPSASHNTAVSAHSVLMSALPNSAELLSASSHMTAVLEDIVFHFNLITMLKLQPASEHIQGSHP